MGFLADAWQVHQQHLLSYLQSLDDETLGARIGRGRRVIEQFAHLHDARVMWLEAVVPGATPTVTKLGREAHSNGTAT